VDRSPQPVGDALWQLALKRKQHALACGALQSIATDYETLDDADIQFGARIVSSLAHKALHRRRAAVTAHDGNPFLPYEQDLFVAAVGDRYICLLNKYNVLDNHLLVITREFEDQESLLSIEDFQALWTCFPTWKVLAFYNSGKISGASQPHKHIQLVPIDPFVAVGKHNVVAIADEVTAGARRTVELPFYRFQHYLFALNRPPNADVLDWAHETSDRYLAVLDAAGLLEYRAGATRITGAYNLLIGPRWLLLVLRLCEHFQGITINALGFAGSFFLQNREQLQQVRKHGPLKTLRAVAVHA